MVNKYWNVKYNMLTTENIYDRKAVKRAPPECSPLKEKITFLLSLLFLMYLCETMDVS